MLVFHNIWIADKFDRHYFGNFIHILDVPSPSCFKLFYSLSVVLLTKTITLTQVNHVQQMNQNNISYFTCNILVLDIQLRYEYVFYFCAKFLLPPLHPFTRMKKNSRLSVFEMPPLPLQVSIYTQKEKCLQGFWIAKDMKVPTPNDNTQIRAKCPEHIRMGKRCKQFPILNRLVILWNSLGKNRWCIVEEIFDFFPFYRFELYFIGRYVYFNLKT